MPSKIAKVVIQFSGAVCLLPTYGGSLFSLHESQSHTFPSAQTATAALGGGQVHMRDRRRHHLAARGCGKDTRRVAAGIGAWAMLGEP